MSVMGYDVYWISEAEKNGFQFIEKFNIMSVRELMDYEKDVQGSWCLSVDLSFNLLLT